VAFLPAPVAAAIASTLLAVLFAMFLAPFGAIVCGPLAVISPDVGTGKPVFEKPTTTLLSIKADGSCFVDSYLVPRHELTAHLRAAREAAPSRALEINADRRLRSDDVTRVLAAARDAGYTEAYVFGHTHSLLEVLAMQR